MIVQGAKKRLIIMRYDNPMLDRGIDHGIDASAQDLADLKVPAIGTGEDACPQGRHFILHIFVYLHDTSAITGVFKWV